MIVILTRFVKLSLGLLSLLLSGCGAEDPKVQLVTDLGDITIKIYTDAAPITAGNFLKYVDEQRFEGASFYRVVTLKNQPDNEVKIEVIQAGLGDNDSNGQRLPPIRHETTRETGILHKDGILSMARLEPGTADAEIFICVGDQPELDFGGRRNPDGQGFAAFGKVIKGMNVVYLIQQQPEQKQKLVKNIEIKTIHRSP